MTQETPLRKHVWCQEGHLCSGRDNYCSECGVSLIEFDEAAIEDGESP